RQRGGGTGPCTYVLRTGDRAGEQCGGLHSTQRCFSRLTDAWRHQFPDATEIPRWGDLSRAGVAIFDLDYDAILAAIAPAAPGAGESALSGTESAQVFHTFTLDSGASGSFFRDRTMLMPLSRPVAVSLADPSGGPVLASFSTVLLCPTAPSGTLLGLYLPSFSTNLSGPESAPCSCRLLSHQTLLWHHHLGHPSLPRLRGMASRVLVSGLPRSLSLLPPGPAPTCIPCVEGRQRAAPHSSEFPPTEAPLQTLHMDVWGPARVRGQVHERYFLLVVDDYSRYTTVFPLRSKGDVTEVLIDWIRAACLQLRESFGSDFPVLRLHSDRGGEFSSACLGAFCRAQGIRQTFTLPASPQQNGIAECRIGMVMDVALRGASAHPIPDSSEFPPTEAPLQTLHMDVWGPARVRGQVHERYFLLVVDDYSRYTTVFPLRSKGDLTEVLIDWICAARLQLRESFGSDFPVLCLHSDRGGEFSSARLGAFCRAQSIRQTFTLPASPQQNGIAECRIGMVMDVARMSMIHVAAPHFLWPFAVQYAAHQLNLQPRVSLPETSPTLRWTGKVGDASAFRVWGSRAFVRDLSADKLSPRAVPCYAAHQLNLQPRVSLPETSPTLRWTGKVGDASAFWLWGSRAFVRDLSADKLSPRAVPCVFLGFPPDAPGWHFCHPTSRRVLSSQDVTFDESVPSYRLFPYRTAPLPPPPLFLAPGPPPVDPLPPQGPAPSGVSQIDAVETVEVAVDSGAARGAGSGGAESGGAEPGGAEPGAAESGGAEPGGAEPGGAESARVASRSASSRRELLSPQELREWFAWRWSRATGAGGPPVAPVGPAGASGAAGAGAAGGVGAGVGAAGASGAASAGATGGVGAGVGRVGAGGAGGTCAATGGTGDVSVGTGGPARPRPYFVPLLEQVLGHPPSPGPPLLECSQPVQSQSLLQPVSPLPAPSPYAGPTGGLAERREPASRPTPPVCTTRTSCRASRPRPSALPGTHQMTLRPSTAPLRVPLPSPPASSLLVLADPVSDSLRAASPTVARVLSTVVTHPSFESTTASALVAQLVDFAAHCRLDYAASLVAESASVCPPSVGGECALSTDVVEDRQEEFRCFAAALPHLVSTLIALEGDPDAPDIPTPRSYAEAIEGPYSSQWQSAMDAEMASWKVKRPPGSLPVFEARYVARGFSQRQGVDYFQTFSPTSKMTTLQVLLHVAAQRDYELHSLDFSTAFQQGSLHEEIWLRRPPVFTVSFPPGTQWSLRRPVYGLCQAPLEWHDTLRTTLATLGFAPSTADPSLFLRTDTSLPLFYILVYVDDLVFATADTAGLAHVKSELQKRHTCTDLGELRSYLGLQITRDRAQRTITLTQSHMVQHDLQHFDFTYSSPQATPLSTRLSLSALPSDESVEPSGPYPELVGCLMYLMTCTRPDLAYPLSILARYVAPGRHRPEHMAAAKRVLRFLCSTSGMGLVLGGRRTMVLTGHGDASWADDQAMQRSSQGYTFSLGSGSVSWRSTRSSSVLGSSCESEIYAGAMAAQELRWLIYLLTDLGEPPRSPPVLTKHIALRYFLARELQQRGQLRLAYVASEANTADIFTKALPPGCFALLDWSCDLLLSPTLPMELGSSGGSVSCPYVIRTGDRAGLTCKKLHTQHRCFYRLDNTWRAEFGDEVERLRWTELLRCGVAIFDLDIDAILTTTYALSVSVEGDCYRCVPPDPGTTTAALGASESATPGTAPVEALHTFTLDSGASRCFFRDSTTLTPLSTLVPVRLVDPSGGPVVARSSTVLPCPAVLSGSLAGLHLPSFSTNLVSASPPALACPALPSLHQEAAACLSSLLVSPNDCSPAYSPHGHGQGREHYFLLVVDDYTRYTTVFPLRSKGEVPDVFVPWIRAVRLQLCERFGQDLPIQRVHSDRGGEFSSDLLRDFCREEGITQSFTLPASSQQNGFAEHRIGLVMEVARTSMIHAAAPHFWWPFAVWYAAHPLNLWPRVSLPETSPTLRWTGKVGDVSVFRVWGSRTFVCDTSADKLSAHAIPCVFLGFPPNAPGWQFYHPTPRRVLPSQDVTFDKSVPIYRLFPYRSAPPPPLSLFLAPGPFPIDPLPPQGPAPSGVSQVVPLPGTVFVEVVGDSGAVSGGAASGVVGPGGAEPGGAEPRGAKPVGVEPGGAEPGGAEPAGVEPGGAASEGAECGGAEPRASAAGDTVGGTLRFAFGVSQVCAADFHELKELFILENQSLGFKIQVISKLCKRFSRPFMVGDSVALFHITVAWLLGVGGVGAPCLGRAGVVVGAGGNVGAALTGPGGARTRGTGAVGTGGVGGTGAGGAGDGDPAEPGGARVGDTGVGVFGASGAGAGAVDPGAGGAVSGGTGAGGTLRQRQCFVLERRELASRRASPVCPAPRAPFLGPPPVPGTHAMALHPSSVPQRVPLPPPPMSSLPGVPDPASDLARAASPTVSRLLATTVTNPAFEFAAASTLVAELVDFAAACRLDYATALVAESKFAIPPSVGGECALALDVLEDMQEDFECLAAVLPRFASMLLAPQGDPDAPDIPTPRSYAEARYVARGFSQRQRVDYFQTFSPTPKMTTVWVLLHVATQRDYETTLVALGFTPSTADPSLFLRTDTSLSSFYVFVYVDDLVFATADTEALTLVKSELQKRHTCTDLGELRSYLGLQITRDRARGTISLPQSHMVHQVLQRSGFQFSLPQPTPLSTSHSLSAPPLNQSIEPSGPYPELVGCLMYLMTCTRPDLAYPLSLLARYVAPGRHRKSPFVLTGHEDASWVDDSASQHSSQGYTFNLGSGSVSWRSTRSSSVLSSSCEAEIYAGAMAAQELRWLTYLLTNLGEQPRSPPVLSVASFVLRRWPPRPTLLMYSPRHFRLLALLFLTSLVTTSTLPLLSEVGEPVAEDAEEVPSPSPPLVSPPLVADLDELMLAFASGDEGSSGTSPVAPAKSIAGSRCDVEQVEQWVEVKQLTLLNEAGVEEGDQPRGAESIDSDVVEVGAKDLGPQHSGRLRRPPELLTYHVCLPPATFTMLHDDVDDGPLYDDAKDDVDLQELDLNMHAHLEHRWDIATMTVKEELASWKGKAVKAAINEEISSFIGIGTWELYHVDDTVAQEKARLVNKTYTPVSSYVTQRIFLSIVAVLDLNLVQLDMKNTFLQSKLDRVLYMYQPDYYNDMTSWVSGDRVAYWVLVYIDDLLAASSSITMLEELLEAAFELHKISPVERYLGPEIVRDRPVRKLWLHQQGYVDKLRRRFIDEEQTGRTPKTSESVDAYTKLTFDEEEAHERQQEAEGWLASVRSDDDEAGHRFCLQQVGERPHSEE
ncbi:unnamed protein product, partial [Closterium sp. NIES-53]